MHLIRDLLDKAVVDRDGREMGRVDGIVLEAGGAEPPRVTAIEIGLSIAAHRVTPVLGLWAFALERAFGIDEGRPVRIPFESILEIKDQVRIDVAANDTAATTVERRLRRVVSSIPGAS